MPPSLASWSPADLAAWLDALALVARGFWGPDPQLGRALASPDLPGEMDRLAGLLGPAGGARAREFAARAGEISQAEAAPELLEEAYVKLFVNRPGGAPAPLYQSCYTGTDRRLMGPAAQRMAARLAAAGLAVNGPGGEPPDHLAAELEYLFGLVEAAAQGGGAAWDGVAEFAGGELAGWLPAWRAALEAAGATADPGGREGPEEAAGAGVAFYQAAAGLLAALLRPAAD
ncbi:MAG: molecular chaperone TorD family protein [Deltaproteobacteria bacterium]|nr:molecular chaperone TorD family protein [Deltaproteobacteria bacterium]